MSQYDDLFDIEEKPKRKHHEDATTWADAWKAIGVFLGSVFSVSLILLVIQQLLMVDIMNKYMEINLSATGSQDFATVFGNFMNTSQNPLFYLASMLLSLVFIVAGLFIVYGLIHVFSTKVLNGDGTLRGLIVRANKWTLGSYLAYVVLAGIAGWVMANNVVSRYEGVNLAASPSLLNDYNSYLLTQLPFLYAVMFGSWLLWCISVSFVAARNYHITKNKGCVGMILTNVTLAGLYCACIFALGFGLAGLMLSS